MTTFINYDSSLHILVIDDDPITYKLLNKLLEREGYRSSHAATGVDGQQMMKVNKYDLVILDWMMPGLSGIDVVRLMRKDDNTRSLPVVMLSSKIKSTDVQEALDAGADDYASKPIIAAELLARIRACIRNSKMQTELTQQLQAIAEIQSKLLPQELPRFKDLNVSAFYKPSLYSGGDYYEVFSIDNRYVALVIADVCGHGAAAMVTMALTRCLLKMKCSKETSPSKAMSIMAESLDDQISFLTFVTMFYSVYDRQTRQFAFSRAGHQAPLYYSNENKKLIPLHVEGTRPLKLLDPEKFYPEETVTLSPGDSLLLFTDGYYEAMNSKEDRLGEEAMANLFLESTRHLKPLNYLLDEWTKFTGNAQQEDDMTLVHVSL